MNYLSIPSVRSVDYNRIDAYSIDKLHSTGYNYGDVIGIVETNRSYVRTLTSYELIDDYVPIPVGYDLPLDHYDFMNLDMILLDMRDVRPEDITPWSISHHGGIVYVISYDPYYTYNKILSDPTKPLNVLYSGTSLIHWDDHKEHELDESLRLLGATIQQLDDDDSNLVVEWSGVEYKLSMGYGIGLSNVTE